MASLDTNSSVGDTLTTYTNSPHHTETNPLHHINTMTNSTNSTLTTIDTNLFQFFLTWCHLNAIKAISPIRTLSQKLHELMLLKVTELKKLATTHAIPCRSKMRKAELAKALVNFVH